MHYPSFLLELIFLVYLPHPIKISRPYIIVLFLRFRSAFIIIVPLKEIKGIEKRIYVFATLPFVYVD